VENNERGRIAWQVVGRTAHAEDLTVIAAATEIPGGEGAHAVGAYTTKGHGAGFAFAGVVVRKRESNHTFGWMSQTRRNTTGGSRVMRFGIRSTIST
jgi:hypothetical protein